MNPSLRVRPVPARYALPLLAGMLAVLVTAVPVLGHASLVSSDPAEGATLDAPPTAITLTFSEGLVAAKSSFELVAPDGSTAAYAKPAADGDTTITTTGLALAGAGTWTIRWTSGAADGDIERGTVTFTVTAPTVTLEPTATAAPKSSAAASPGSSAAPASPAPTAAAPVATSAPVASAPAPSPSTGDGSPAGSTADILLPIAVVVSVVVIATAVVLRRGRTA